MKFKRLVMTAAIAGAVGAGPALAGITGVPGEALLVPLYLNSDGDAADAQAETYVALYVPSAIGRDTVLDYTAPHTNGKSQTIPANNKIYWKLFDKRSNPGASGSCDISLEDKVVWTTDASAYRDAQRAQDNALQDLGNPPPSNICGPNGGGNAGYVVFQTYDGARGLAAPFAFWGNAWIVENVLTAAAYGTDGTDGTVTNLASVPVIPMADGADGAPNLLASFGNEVTMTSPLGGSTPPALGQFDVRPHSAGIRLAGGLGTETNVVVQGEVRGPNAGSEMSMHVLWFSQNSDVRSFIGVNIFDDQEGYNDFVVDLGDELNVLLYNYDVNIVAGAETPSLLNVGENGFFNTNQRFAYLLDVIGANAGSPAIRGQFYDAPQYWNPGTPTNYYGALNGYVEYFLPVERDANGFAEAAVAFQWNEILSGQDTTPATFSTAWSSELMTDLGKR